MILNGPRPHSSKDLWRPEGRMTSFRRTGCAGWKEKEEKEMVPSPSRKQAETFCRPSKPVRAHLWLNTTDMYLKRCRYGDA